MLNANTTTEVASVRLFITWFTSIADGLDHAVTDEAFAENRGAPTTFCGAVIEWGPMELPSGPLCEACRGVLGVAATTVLSGQKLPVEERRPLAAGLLAVVEQLCEAARLSPFGWSCRRNATNGAPGNLFGASSQLAVTPTGDHPEPPAGMRRNQVPAGETAGEGATSRQASVSSPAQFASGTVSVTGVRRAVQPNIPPAADRWPVGVGLGGPNPSATPLSFPAAAEIASAGQTAAGTVVPPGMTQPRRDDHQLPAAGLSPATPEGRDGQQDAARPRRCVLLADKHLPSAVEVVSAAWALGRIGPELPPAPADIPVPTQR